MRKEILLLLLIACALFVTTRTAHPAEVYEGRNIKGAVVFNGDIDMSSVDKAIALAEQKTRRPFTCIAAVGMQKPL